MYVTNIHRGLKSGLMFLGKSGFVVGSIMGAGVALNTSHCNNNVYVITESIKWGVIGFAIGATFPVSVPILCNLRLNQIQKEYWHPKP